MPPLRRYIVTQTREVKVSATNLIDAVTLADRVLKGEKKPDDQINVISDIREVDVNVREDY
jgi:uncharacterized iron-regulated protein